MANKYTDAVFQLCETDRFDGYDKAVLGALAFRADNETGECYPGYTRIANDVCFSYSQVKRSVKRLDDLKLITFVSGGGDTRNTYTLNLANINKFSLETSPKKKKPKKKRKEAPAGTTPVKGKSGYFRKEPEKAFDVKKEDDRFHCADCDEWFDTLAECDNHPCDALA